MAPEVGTHRAMASRFPARRIPVTVGTFLPSTIATMRSALSISSSGSSRRAWSPLFRLLERMSLKRASSSLLKSSMFASGRGSDE